MSLLSLPNELLVNYVFSHSDIKISDLYHLMHSCTLLRNIIFNSNQLWRRKYEERWGYSVSLKRFSKNEVNWLEVVGIRLRVAKDVQEIVETLSSLCYPDPESFELLTPSCVMDKLLATAIPFSEFVEEELEQLAFMNFWQSDGYGNLTLAYHAERALRKVRTSLLEGKWWDFLEQDSSQKTLLEATVLVSQWLEVPNEHFPSLQNIKDYLGKITQRVKELIIEKQRSFYSLRAVNANPKVSPREILTIINYVLFHESEQDFMDTLWLDKELDFHELQKNISIAKVMERRESCTTILCVIYQEVASSMGIQCELVYCDSSMDDRDRLLLKWLEYPKHEGGKGFTYIDVCDGGTVHRPDHLRRIGPLRHQNEDFQYYFVDPAQPAEKGRVHSSANARALHQDGQTDLWLDRRSQTVSEVARLARLACIISSLIGEAPELVLEYAEHCFNYGVQLSDAIHLLEAEGLQDHPLLGKCILQLEERRTQIAAYQQVVSRRVPSIKYAVGLVMIYNYTNAMGEVCNEICVITSWEVKGSAENYLRSVGNLDQPFYHVLTRSHADHSLACVPEDKLVLHPDVGSVIFLHDQLGFHFERFDGRRFVPNAGKRYRFPDDEAFALNLTKK
ncbi:LOW QUALITY PROTEIN: F-box only protein 21 [Daphnia magna]|uniref:LOW QUALITY PROTEIN: F-box only protein 21 n=1 Tax=Daphnia magna TaxID=35525 RepID=UPI001E1BC369|nr:LOW QUALITY PROTEIN: F-box only protein 21 [Daphnia magna]